QVTGDQFRFAVPPQWEDRKDDVAFEGRLDGNGLAGETTDDKSQRLKWTPARPRRSSGNGRQRGASPSTCSTERALLAGNRSTKSLRAAGSPATACSSTPSPATTS